MRDNAPTEKLTGAPKGATLAVMGLAFRATRFSARTPLMKTFLRAPFRASKTDDSVRTSLSRRPEKIEGLAGQEQHRDGRAVRSDVRIPVAEVHGRRLAEPAGYGHAHAVLRDGSIGTRRADDGARAEADARCGRDRRARPAVSASHQPSHALTGHISPAILEHIARDAIKRAAMAPTPASALDIAGEALLALARIAQREVPHV